MFTAEAIQNRVRQRPFTPLRIVTSSGESVDVHHPDLVLVGNRDVIVGIPRPGGVGKYYEDVTRIAYMHITELRDLPAPTAPGANGVAG